MKRLAITALAASFAFVSCENKKKDPEEYIVSENLIVYTSEASPEQASVTTPFYTTPVVEKDNKLSYALNGTSVELAIDGEIVKTLEYYYTPDMSKIAVADYNFDGFDDIYIPYEYPTDYGYYYCYDPKKNTFEENAELAGVGRFMTITDDMTLTEHHDDGYIDRTTVYKWTDGKLNPVMKTDVYKSTVDNLVHTDIYRYDSNGIEYLDEAR